MGSVNLLIHVPVLSLIRTVLNMNPIVISLSIHQSSQQDMHSGREFIFSLLKSPNLAQTSPTECLWVKGVK